ncbi:MULTISPECIES: LysR family transcriptional regulator [unclassified Pseudomonas]|uniref:LysR family transcriptional regulator n=1 Tax=unclassified Pseudomonas TaxID=196821 RepID=UPI00209789EA|nr:MULTISPECIES: LysR family transcriptional regulator [unclassified Pseudomonas]MCO7520386.1 LysR family transcriptional regulator [Pseudomonas sp. 1]MCO7542595.1 LysR family transcriptional regulator [Pseudomonas sp. VA159-2]
MNWDDARMLLALSREQTLRRAARLLRVDQATVGRRVAALEADLGSTLFLRTPGGYQLTAIGEVAVEMAQKMEHAALELARRTRGADNEEAGEVRIATTDSLAHEFVIPALRELRQSHPEVRVVLSGGSDIVNLSQRETDIAIRNQRPDSPDLVLRKLASWQMGLFAAEDYLQRHGLPQDGSFAGHDLVVYEPYWRGQAQPTLVDVPIGEGRVVMAANASMLLRRALHEGLGIGEIPLALGQRDGLRRVWPQRTRAQPYEVWMVTHQDLRHTARVRAVIERLVAAFE